MLSVAGLLMIASVPLALAASSGDMPLCNPQGNFGCSTWFRGDRAQCTDPNMGAMEWCTRPVYTPNYQLHTEGDGYIPGTYIELGFDVTEYGWKYRGLYIDAVDENNISVGSFRFPDTENALFWEPPRCPGGLIHIDADPKPNKVSFIYATPPVGTGTIRFRALVKRGPANVGEFYFPNGAYGDLTLTERGAAYLSTPLSAAGQSCDEFCEAQDQICDVNTLAVLDGQDGFSTNVQAAQLCPSPLEGSCSTVAPAMDTNGTCYFMQTECSTSSTANPCSTRPEGWRCGSKKENVKRFCKCTSAGSERKRRSPQPTRRDATNAAAHTHKMTALPTVCAALASAVLSLSSTSRSASLVSFALMAMQSSVLIQPADAHNWMVSPSRAIQEASTTAPCRARKESDTHAQVGPGQEFVIKWATGHSRPSYFLIIHESNEQWLRDRNLRRYMEDYLSEAPEGANTAMDPAYQRYHGYPPNLDAQFRTYKATPEGSSIFANEIMPTDANFLNNSRVPTAYLWSFQNSALQEDSRVSYRSETYPWIEGVYKYEHLSERPIDYDAVRVTIPGYAGPGHYIVYWEWNGYFDCIDADLFDSPVEHIDGLISDSHVWNKIDHCQYVEPRHVVTQCRPVLDSAKDCIDDLSGPWWDSSNRYGVNSVPLIHPKDVLFKNVQSNIPFLNSTCMGSNEAFSPINGTDTTSAPSVSLQSRLGDAASGMMCDPRAGTVFTIQATLDMAVKRCSVEAACVAIAWTGTTSVWSGTWFQFQGCRSTTSTTAAGRYVFTRPPAYDPTVDTSILATQTYHVSFQPAEFTDNITLPTGMVADNGLEFGSRLGLTYGWKCAMPSRITGGIRERALAPYWWAITGGSMGIGFSVSTGANAVPDVNTTYAANLGYSTCADRSQNKWEIQVPNGVYRVTTVTNPAAPDSVQNTWDLGCSIEGMVMQNVALINQPPQLRVNSGIIAQVTDGRLTLTGSNQNYPFFFKSTCSVINSIKIERIGSALPPMWYPGSGAGGAWWQREFPAPTPVGLVSISFPTGARGQIDCRTNWFFKGQSCIANGPMGNFTGSNEGAVLSVSNQSCTASGCPSTGQHVCEDVSLVPLYNLNDGSNRYRLIPMDINCHGVIGRYVRLHLPGSDRILDVTIEVHRSIPQMANMSHEKVCYGVEARPQTTTSPEYITSNDPTDPVFYSTCYQREQNISWRAPVGGRAKPATPQWAFNGQCLDCTNYRTNAMKDVNPNATLRRVPTWQMADVCTDCDRATPYLMDGVTTVCSLSTEQSGGGGSGNGSDGSSNGGSSGAAAAGAVVAIVLVAAIGILLYRRRHASSGGKGPSYEGQHQVVDVHMNELYGLSEDDTSLVPTNKAGHRKPSRPPPMGAASAASAKDTPRRPPPPNRTPDKLSTTEHEPVATTKNRPRFVRSQDTTVPVPTAAATPLRPAKPTGAPPTRSVPTPHGQTKPTRPPPSRPSRPACAVTSITGPTVPQPATRKPSLAAKPKIPARKPKYAPRAKSGKYSSMASNVAFDSTDSGDDLPPPPPATSTWEAFVDDASGAIYYVDSTTGASEWNAPFDSSWTAEVSTSGEVYFVHSETGATQWECPCYSGESEI
eukprot:m.960219 g.960219  ORF g.960219 m.960219 type:complete len:1597 (+) comp23883_c0_seq1:128-4918(+)